MRAALASTGVIVNGGIAGTVPFVIGGGANVGVVLRARDGVRRGTRAVRRRRLAGFVQGSIGATVVGATGSVGTDADLGGVEYSVGLVGVRSPIYGNRVFIPFVPPLISLAASREGGLGVGVSLPTPLGWYPLVRAHASIYLDNPAFARASNKLLDAAEAVAWRFHRATGPARRRIEVATRPLRVGLAAALAALVRHLAPLRSALAKRSRVAAASTD
jgi:hypothetical protein